MYRVALKDDFDCLCVFPHHLIIRLVNTDNTHNDTIV